MPSPAISVPLLLLVSACTARLPDWPDWSTNCASTAARMRGGWRTRNPPSKAGSGGLLQRAFDQPQRGLLRRGRPAAACRDTIEPERTRPSEPDPAKRPIPATWIAQPALAWRYPIRMPRAQITSRPPTPGRRHCRARAAIEMGTSSVLTARSRKDSGTPDAVRPLTPSGASGSGAIRRDSVDEGGRHCRRLGRGQRRSSPRGTLDERAAAPSPTAGRRERRGTDGRVSGPKPATTPGCTW